MREIKFNAWVPKLGVMLENVTLYPDGTMGICSGDFEEALPEKYILTDDAVYHEDNEKDIYELIMTILPGEDWIWLEKGEFEPLQFIGLTDKNGKDIFEGDIVNYVYYIQTSIDPDSTPKVYKGIGVVNFIEGCFMVRPLKNVENPIPLHYGDLSFEIIGNIYENTELLKQ